MYHAPVFANGDTRKQLLARSIYLLYKKESLWTQSQRIRAEILFKEYPDIKKGYYLSMRLGLIYHQCKFKDIALTRLARWYDEVDKSGFLTFGRVARSFHRPLHKQSEWTLHPKPPSELLHASPAQLHKLTSVRESDR